MSNPSPSPERAIYGFVLYIASIIGFGLYIIWAYVPESYLQYAGLTYLPQKYWALAAPTYFTMALLFAYIFYIGYNFTITLPLDSVHTITDDHALSVERNNQPVGAIPQNGDVSISDVNQRLYL